MVAILSQPQCVQTAEMKVGMWKKNVHPVKGKIGDIFSVSIVITFHVDLFHLLVLFQMSALYSLGWLISIAYVFF